MLEKDVQIKLVDYIQEHRTFLNLITNLEDFQDYENEGNTNFDIDKILKRKNLKKYSDVLDELLDLEIILADKNVSSEKKETLRPDIVLFNPDGNYTFIIVEIKKDKQTEREAITELLAYQQEIKNACPFVSDKDINFVLISKDWSPLLKHSVENINSWTSKSILPLKLNIVDNSEIELKVFETDAWTDTNIGKIPRNTLSCFTICLYEKNYGPREKIDDNLKENALFAANMISEILDKNDYHGFVFLWDSLDDGICMCKWQITVVFFNGIELLNFLNFEKPVIDNIGIENLTLENGELTIGISLSEDDYEQCIDKNNQSKLIQYFMENRFDYCNITPHNATKVIDQAIDYLSNFFHPTFEGFVEWDSFRHYFANLYDENYYKSNFLLMPLSQPYAYPVFCKCFGILGDFVRDNYKFFIEEKSIRYDFITNPHIIINYIENITQSHIRIDTLDEEDYDN